MNQRPDDHRLAEEHIFSRFLRRTAQHIHHRLHW